jgi:hypothetical protein
MDASQELSLIRSRIDRLESRLERLQLPNDPGRVLLVGPAAQASDGVVSSYPVRTVRFEQVEGAAPVVETTDATVPALTLGGGSASLRLCVPIRGSRYVVLA